MLTSLKVILILQKKNVCSNTSSSQSSSSNSRLKCHTFHGFAHIYFQCPSKPVAMLEKDCPKRNQEAIKGSEKLELEKICEPLNANLKVNFDDLDLDDEGKISEHSFAFHRNLTRCSSD